MEYYSAIQKNTFVSIFLVRPASSCSMGSFFPICTGMTHRDGMGRAVGGGFRIGTRVHPWWMHVDVWQNQYNVVK